MKRRVTKLTSFILAIILSLPFTVFTMAQGEQATNDETDIVYELTELRNEFEKHYLMSDGTVVAATYAEPVNYYDKTDGTWKEIDNTLTQVGGRYRNKGHGGFDVSFRGDGSSGDLVEITVDGHTLSWSVSVQNESGVKDTVKVQANATVKQKDTKRTDKFAADKASSGMRYNSPFSGNKIIDVDYSVSQYKVKEDITIYSSKDANVLQYTYNCGSLTAVLNEDNSIYFLVEAGEAVYTVHKPYMYDSAGNGSYEFDIVLRQRGSVCTVVMVPDKAWLDTAVYPVVIDPTISNRKILDYYDDTYIHSGDSAGLHASETVINIGKKNGVQNYGLVRIGILPMVPANATVLEARFLLHLPENSSSGGPFTLKHLSSSWSEATVCYNNRPTANTVIASSVPADFGALTITFDITSHYNMIKAGTRVNNGFWIENTDTALNDFNSPYSSECGDVSLFPALVVVYTIESESENNNSISSANFIDMPAKPSLVASVQGIISSTSDVDYYKITPPRHGRIEVTISAVQCSHEITILNSSGAVVFGPIQTNKASMNGQQVIKHIDFTFLTAKTSPLTDYYIKVEGINGSTFNDYYMSVRYTTSYSMLQWEYPLEPFADNSANYNLYATSPVGARGGGYHNALDIGANWGEELTAVTDAYVAKSNYHYSATGMGNYVVLWTGAVNTDEVTREVSEKDPYTNLPFAVVYMHMSSRSVDVGDVVEKGAVIGYVGNTGGPDYLSHLHIEIYVTGTMPVSPEGNPHANTVAPSIESIINPYAFFYDEISFVGTPY